MDNYPKLYTTNFNNLAELPDNIIPITICIYPPIQFFKEPHYKYLTYTDLYPDNVAFFKYKSNRISRKEFELAYMDKLNKLDPNKVVYELLRFLPEGCTCALVCHEPKNNFCHRHLVAKWLRDAGFNIEEFE